MSRVYNIRWQESDSENLRKAVRNFNAKIRRLEQKHPELKKVLPERISVAEIKNLVKTRQDLNREIKSLQRFSRRGAEEMVDVPGNDNNLKTTAWQKKEMIIRSRTINRRRKERLKQIQEINLERKKKDLGYSQVDIGMGKQDEVQLTPVKPFSAKMENYNLRKKFKGLRKESQSTYWDESDLRLKQNYFDQIIENFGSIPESEKLIQKIDNMSFKDFYSIYRKDPNKFEHFYFPNEEAKQQAWEDLKSVWEM